MRIQFFWGDAQDDPNVLTHLVRVEIQDPNNSDYSGMFFKARAMEYKVQMQVFNGTRSDSRPRDLVTASALMLRVV